MTSLWLDVRYALRMMAKLPGLTAVLAITLALGIGASTTIFSVVNSVVLRPLPYEQPDQLVRIYTEFRSSRLMLEKFTVSPPELDDLQRGCRTCASVGAWKTGTASLSAGDRPVRITVTFATHQLLPLLGVKPLYGRWFDATEDRPGDPTVIVLGHGVWKRAFDGDPSIIGRQIRLDAAPVTVIGVMPEGFDFLHGKEAWIPIRIDFARESRGNHNLHVIARLRPGESIAALRDELNTLTGQWQRAAGPRQHSMSVANPWLPSHPMIAVPFHADLVGSLSTTLWLLQGAVLFVLLIAIVNMANLLLARSETRTREVAVRHALGASRPRLIRQFVTESLITGALGGALGILVAMWAVDGVTALIPSSVPRANEISLDVTAVGFAIACSFGAALLFGIAPIVHARKSDLHSALKDGSPRMTGSKARLRARRSLVIVEITLAVVLVLGCAVMVRSFVRLQQVDLGFAPDHLLTLGIELPPKIYPPAACDAFWRRVEERMRALPGVEAATLLDGLPTQRGTNTSDIGFPGRTQRPDEPAWNVDYWLIVGEDAIATLGARIVKGRDLRRSDGPDAPPVALVNETFAAKFWPGLDPIGQKINASPWGTNRDNHHSQTVVGVVANIKQAGVDQPALSEIFLPLYQYKHMFEPPERVSSMRVVLRTKGDPSAMIPAAQRAIAELDPALPVEVRTMDDVLGEAVARPRFLTFLLTSFAGLALLLAAVGIYGVMAHTVAQRTHEIGLRIALGAQPSQVRAMVVRQAGALVATGVAVGLGAAIGLQLVLDASLAGLFYGARLSQPLLLIGVTAVVAATSLIATWLPARRATGVQPTVALRSE